MQGLAEPGPDPLTVDNFDLGVRLNGLHLFIQMTNKIKG